MIAFVLAAGLGTRFRPATLATPKPLLPFLGRPILSWLLDGLIARGTTRFVVNTHHLPERIADALGDAFRGVPVTLSHEPELLGTAGAIRCAAERGLLGEAPFLVVNGDLFTTLPVARLVERAGRGDAATALAVLPNSRPDLETPLWADADGRLVAVGGGRPEPSATGPWLFTGIQAATERLVARIPPGASELARDVLRPSAAARDGAIALVPFRTPEDGFWFDLGTPERLAAAEQAVRAAEINPSAPTSSSREGPRTR